MLSGKLYSYQDDRFVSDINYQLFGETAASYWGELVPLEYAAIGSSDDYVLELEDSQKIRCNLRKRVNVATIGIPPRFIYHFTGRTL
jgi:hypothetical protein